MTLRQFIKQEGSCEGAAAKLGVGLRTLYRWLNGENRPQGNNARRLAELGVTA